MACRRSPVRARLAPFDERAALRGGPFSTGDRRPYARGRRAARASMPPLLDRALGRLAPELLEAVVLAGVRREDVDDDVEVVHEDPARLGQALDAARKQPVVLLHVLVDAIVDRLGL